MQKGKWQSVPSSEVDKFETDLLADLERGTAGRLTELAGLAMFRVEMSAIGRLAMRPVGRCEIPTLYSGIFAAAAPTWGAAGRVPYGEFAIPVSTARPHLDADSFDSKSLHYESICIMTHSVVSELRAMVHSTDFKCGQKPKYSPHLEAA